MLIRMALRNLFRHRWRTILTVGGIALSTALLIWLLAMLSGIYDEMAQGSTSVEIGQVQIRSAEYVERQSIHHFFELDEEMLRELGAIGGVSAVAPRVLLSGLVGHEDHSRIARIKGVDPDREAQVTVLEQALTQGRWLSQTLPDEGAPREIILGVMVARALDVEVGDELVVLLQAADGSLGNELLEVTGIVETGTLAIDRHTVFMHLEDVQFIGALDGQIHELALSTSLDGAPGIAREIRRLMAHSPAGEELVTRPWQEIAPELYLMTELAEQVSWWLLLIIFAVAALGTFNTLRMSTLERRREFGVMMGVGLSRTRLMTLIVVEGIAIGIAGAVVGGSVGAAAAIATGTYGLPISLLSSQDTLTLMGVALSEYITYDVAPWTIMMPVVGILLVTVICAIWPAAMAIRPDPKDAIAGRQ